MIKLLAKYSSFFGVNFVNLQTFILLQRQKSHSNALLSPLCRRLLTALQEFSIFLSVHSPVRRVTQGCVNTSCTASRRQTEPHSPRLPQSHMHHPPLTPPAPRRTQFNDQPFASRRENVAHKSDRKGEVTTDLPAGAGACARDYLFALELKMGQLST